MSGKGRDTPETWRSNGGRGGTYQLVHHGVLHSLSCLILGRAGRCNGVHERRMLVNPEFVIFVELFLLKREFAGSISSFPALSGGQRPQHVSEWTVCLSSRSQRYSQVFEHALEVRLGSILSPRALPRVLNEATSTLKTHKQRDVASPHTASLSLSYQ